MNKVEMIISGKRALVDADQVKKHLKKEQLVQQALRLQKMDLTVPAVSKELRETMGKIIRLNRTIRQNVKFIQ